MTKNKTIKRFNKKSSNFSKTKKSSNFSKTKKLRNTKTNKTKKTNKINKKNKKQFGGNKCEIFLINVKLKINEIKQIINGDKESKKLSQFELPRLIFEKLEYFNNINEDCDDISSKQIQDLLNKLKDLKNNDTIGFLKKPEFSFIAVKLEEIINRIETFKSFMEGKESKKREIEGTKELEKREIERIKELEKQQKKEINRLETERLKKVADERKQKQAEDEKEVKRVKEQAKKEAEEVKNSLYGENKMRLYEIQKQAEEVEEARKQAEEAIKQAEEARKQAEEAEGSQMSGEEKKSINFEEEMKRKEAEEERIKIQQISEEKLALEKVEYENLPQIHLFQFLTPDDNEYLKQLFKIKLVEQMRKIFPNIATDYSQNINILGNNDPYNYKYISSFIIILIGVFNNRLKIANSNIKFVLKGGKSAQMMISKNNIKDVHILSDDVDILVLFDGKYNRLYVKNISEQLADIINYYINPNPNYPPLISILNPDLNPTNPNIVKISFINSQNGRFLPLSDIDFKQIETQFFDSLEETTKYLYTDKKQTYKFDLLYYHQNIQSFIDEKKFYLNKYLNPIQQTETGETCDCNNKMTDICLPICLNRNKMIEKFNKYIAPFELLYESIQNR